MSPFLSSHTVVLHTAWEKKRFLQMHKKIKLLIMLSYINDTLQPAQVSYTYVHAYTHTFCHRTQFQILPAHEAIICIYHLHSCPYILTYLPTPLENFWFYVIAYPIF